MDTILVGIHRRASTRVNAAVTCQSEEGPHVNVHKSMHDKESPSSSQSAQPDDNLRTYLPHFIFCFLTGVLSVVFTTGSPSLCEMLPTDVRLAPATGEVGWDLTAASRTFVSADILANRDMAMPRPLPFSLPFHLHPAALKPAIKTLRSSRASALAKPLR